MQHPDVIIAGAGIVGLSVALELAGNGVDVLILERSAPIAEASVAAAGMLAAHDPFNPPALQPLSDLSLRLYPGWLRRIAELSGVPVPFHTRQTLQLLESSGPQSISGPQLDSLLPFPHQLDRARTVLLDEVSVDPRELAPALLEAATHHPRIELLAETPLVEVVSLASGGVSVVTHGSRLEASAFIDCTGAWARTGAVPVSPRKGQMLSVALPPDLPLRVTIRSEHLYIVPRLTGPRAGQAVIGATVEDAGFSKSVDPAVLRVLQREAAELLPGLAVAPMVDSWAGLRPATPDLLPLLGPLPGRPSIHIAAGHFRNGILLAPATALVVAEQILGNQPSVDLAPFAPGRLTLTPA